MEQYEARTADRCEKGKGCCVLRVLEVEYVLHPKNISSG